MKENWYQDKTVYIFLYYNFKLVCSPKYRNIRSNVLSKGPSAALQNALENALQNASENALQKPVENALQKPLENA